MSSSSPFNPGDVVQVRFPFVEGEDASGAIKGKDRPALIVSGPGADGNFVAVPLTSASHHPNTVPVNAGDYGTAKARAGKTSFVRADRLFTFHASAVIQAHGSLKPAFVQKVHKTMCAALGCK